MDEIRFLGDMERLQFKPGDKFILKVPGRISSEIAARMKQAWHEFMGGNPDEFKLLIIEEGMTIGVLGDGDIAA